MNLLENMLNELMSISWGENLADNAKSTSLRVPATKGSSEGKVVIKSVGHAVNDMKLLIFSCQKNIPV